MCLIGTGSENDRLGRLRICVLLNPQFLNGRFGRFGRFGMPTEHSAPKSRRFGRLWKDS